MSERYKYVPSCFPSFITLTIVDWVDLFIRPEYFRILDQSLNYCIENKGLRIHAYVYMTSHLHLIVNSDQGVIPSIIRDFKKYTSKKLIESIREVPESRRVWLLNKFAFEANRGKRAMNYKLWKDGFHPVLLDTSEKLKQKISYIHQNPVSAEYVYHAEDWINSSCLVYMDDFRGESNVKVEPLNSF